MNVGAHLSVAGGLAKAFERARAETATALQIFTRNQRQWSAKPLDPDAVRAFRAARQESSVGTVVSHASYLVNLATPDDALWERSVATLTDELDRAIALGLDGVVFHPGAHMGSGVDAGLSRIATGVRRVLAAREGGECRLLFETTVGAGTQLGGRFEEIARLLATSGPRARLGVCIDTCHVFAAGYDIRTPAAYRRTRRDFDSIVGLGHLAVVHVNDSKGKLGSRLDRHEHVGRGRIGEAGFRALMRDKRLAGVPKILETPKGRYRNQSWDKRNITLLRRLRDER